MGHGHSFGVCMCRVGCDVRGTAACAVTATCGGCLVVDLQPSARKRAAAMPHDALVFGPLPCRANHIANRAARARKYMYSLPPCTEAANFQPSASQRASASRQRDLSGSSSVRRISLERVSVSLAERGGGLQAHLAAYRWRRLAGECAPRPSTAAITAVVANLVLKLVQCVQMHV